MPIELGTFDVIIGMDWLADNDAVIICGKKEVHIPIKNRTLVVKGDSNSSRLKVISCIKARKYIERGCHLFLAHVTEKEKSEKRLEDVPVIRDFPEVFPDDLPGLPPPRQVEFKIDLVSGAAPVVHAPYRLAPSEMKELSEQLKELLEKGFIRPSSSPWGAPVLFVKKKDGSFRMCIDYRELNKLTVKNRYPLPNMRFIRSTSRFKCIFKRIDLLSRGIINSAFEKRISPSQPLYERLASKDHFGNLLKKEKLNPNSRMRFWLESVQFLGHVINREGVHVDPAKIEAIKNWPVPTSPTEKRYSVGVRMRIEVFQKLKQDLCTAPILALPEGLIDFVVYCDASLKGYGAVLMQRDKVIAYASWQLKTHEKTTLLTISNWVLWFLPLDSGDITSMSEVGDSQLTGPELIRKTTEKIIQIKNRLLTARSRQKSYADVRRKPMEFNVGDMVMLKVSPWKGVISFEPCYIHLKKSSWTINCSSSKPWKCYGSREVKQLKQSRIPIVKVRWNSWRGPEFTWEREDFFMKKYPHLFPSKKRGTCHNRAPGNVASRKDGVKMDNPNISMEEYIRLEEEKARRRGKVYYWEIATYGKIWDNEDVHDLRYVETEFPAIAFNDTLTSEATFSCEPKIQKMIMKKSICLHFHYPSHCFDDLDFFNDLENEFPAIVYNDAQTSKLDDLEYFKDFENEFSAIVYNDAQTF
ncbi:putative reverse transcriptase domain-containing protein [Tanacetum coccineum]